MRCFFDFDDYEEFSDTSEIRYCDNMREYTDNAEYSAECSDKGIIHMLDSGEHCDTNFRICDIPDEKLQDYEISLKAKSLAAELLEKSEHNARGLMKYSEYISDVANYKRNGGDAFSGDLLHEIMSVKDGFCARGEVLDEEAFETASHGKTLLYRGLSAAPDGKSAFEMSEEFKFSESFYHGLGIYGNGIYMSPREDIARYYSDGTFGSGITAFLSDDARIITYEDLLEHKNRIDLTDGTYIGDLANELISDNGRFAQLCGYDAISLDGYASQDHMIILNRSKLTIKR